MSNNFEEVERAAQEREAFVSIGRDGLYLNETLWNRHFEGVEAIRYLTARDDGKLAVVPADAGGENTYAATPNAGDQRGSQFSAGLALTKLGIELSRRVRPDWEWDDDLGGLVVDMTPYRD